MSARNPPRQGWVTVAAAAAALTEAGDPIDASNVSRYLARNPDVPSEKQGKFRLVDLAKLAEHRRTSIYVSDKRDARELEPMRPAFAPSSAPDDDDEPSGRPNSALQAGKLELQQLDLRKRRREEAVEEGRLVPIEDLQTVVAAMMGAFVGELARQEQHLTAKYGRDVGAEVRKAHKAARTAAATRLVEAAQQALHPEAVGHVAAGTADPAEAA